MSGRSDHKTPSFGVCVEFSVRFWHGMLLEALPVACSVDSRCYLQYPFLFLVYACVIAAVLYVNSKRIFHPSFLLT
jgi:hypothetical protein